MTTINLRYGNTSFPCRWPGARVLSVVPPSPALAREALIHAALDAPWGSPPLEEIVRPGETVTIVTSDITRYTGSEHYLPILVERLEGCGVDEGDITILIALGIHRKQSQSEHRKILGPLYGRIRVCDHECDNPARLVTIGRTTGGIPVTVNRLVAEADRVIVTGTAGFHYFAGFGGGRKGLVPGVASRETCMATHFSVFLPASVGGRHPRATTGVLAGNPVHEGLLEAARMIAPDFLLNTVLTPEKEILQVFCGDLESAHLAACAKVRDLYAVPLDAAADLAIVSCGGDPKDINFIQAHKALDYGVRALRPGGTLVLLAACPDGFGNPTFFDWFRHQDLPSFEAALRQGYEINGQTAYATLAKARAFRVILVSELGEVETGAMGMEKAADLDEALALAREGRPQTCVIIPDGGTVVPMIIAP